MKVRTRRKRNRKYKKTVGAVVILLCIVMMLSGYAAAKYKFQKTEEPLYTAEAFYFESDLLSDSQIVPAYTYSGGADSIRISLFNYADKLRYSEGDISYRVALTGSDGQQVLNTSGDAVGDVTGTITAGEANTTVIEFSELPAGSYLVTAAAEGKYQKVLKGNFTLSAVDKEIAYTVSDSEGSPVLLLTVTAKDYSGDIVISWPSGVAPDSTDPYFEAVDRGYNGGSCKIAFANNSEYTFRFFKKEPSSVYDNSGFSVQKGE